MKYEMQTDSEERSRQLQRLHLIDKNNGAKDFVFRLGDDVANLEGVIEDVRNYITQILAALPEAKGKRADSLPLRSLFASGLRFKMQSNKISAVKLSRLSRLSEKSIGRVLDGSANSCVDTLEQIAESLGCTALDIIEMGY